MSKILETVTLAIVILGVLLQNAICENQPRFTSHEGDLIIQSAQDKNITIRVRGSSRLLINEINALDFFQKATQQKLARIDDDEFASLADQVASLKSNVQGLMDRLRSLTSGRNATASGRIRRLDSRITRLFRRIIMTERLLRQDDCLTSPCENGGKCYDLIGSYHCECPEAWTGRNCSEDVNECYSLAGTDLGCQNSAACVNLPGSYRCVCTKGFTGIHCRERGTDCAKSRPGELCGHGACIPTNNDQGYKCICDAGWKTDNLTQACNVDVNECIESLVPCHTSCINLPGSFMCGPCPSGYTGNGLKCRDIDECATNNGGCSILPKVQCINTEGSFRCGNCPPGWAGDGRYCTKSDSNSCDSSICHPLARCEFISNTMVCVCPEGMTGSGYGPAGCRSGSANPCNEHQCRNGGTCISHGSSYTCLCPRGFDPPYCSRRNPCAEAPCLNGGTCEPRLDTNTFRCVCPPGATGLFCQNKRNTCGSVIQASSGVLTHPAEGTEFKPNQACAWVIRTTDALVLNVTFNNFSVQSDAECNKAWLQVNDGRSLATPLIGRFCGNQLPHDGNILTSQNFIFLWFRTDNTTNNAGFSLSWNSTTPICGGRQVVNEQGHGIIKSPGYPGKSPRNRDCEWIIVAPFGKRVVLRFYEVVMERSANCTKDSLSIYDTNELLGNVCETGVPAPIFTSSNVMKLHFHTDPYREDSSFQAHFEVVAGKPGCGGLFTESEGRLKLSSDMTNCLFLIQQPAGTRIFINFTTEDSPYVFDSIKVFDGKSVDSPVLSDFVGGPLSMPGQLWSTGNFMTIFPTNRYSIIRRSNPSMYASYKRVCGQELRDSLGTFTTPNYPKPYFADLNCEYSIVGPQNTVVHFNITDYDVSEYETCDEDSDFVQFFFSISGSGERHCKDGPTLHVVAPSNYLLVKFHSNANPQKRRGISAQYSFEEIGCGGVLRDPEGSFDLLDPISSSNSYCEWILEAPPNRVISLDSLYKRTGTKCSPGETDLKIFLNSTKVEGRLVESHCGGEKRIGTILPGNMATIFLKLVPPGLGSGLAYSIQANYSFIERTSNCGGNYSLLSGSIQSPGWPDDYSDSTDCTWVIHAPLGNKIELTPMNFSMEPSLRNCEDDYLEIRNGMTATSPLIGRYCGNSIPPHIPSFTNHLYIHFHSDSTFSYPGFDISFRQTTTGCGGSLNSFSGSIQSPHYPEIIQGPIQCDWKITVSQGSAIKLSVIKLNPNTQSTALCLGALTIFDGEDIWAKKLSFDNCTSSAWPVLKAQSSRNVIVVRYVVPDVGTAESEPFYLSYETDCQRTINTLEGVIESPNFPEDYPNFIKCEWNIVGRKSDTISLTFSHFELEPNDLQCTFDSVKIIDMKGDETLQTHNICLNPPEVLVSDGNRLMVKFSTDFSHTASGFRLEFKRNGCGGILTRSSGIFASPNKPYSVDVDCEWFIETIPGKLIVLDIFEVHIEVENGDCSTNGLIVKNDKNDTKELLKECKVKPMPMTVTSHGSTMYVRFYSDAIRSRKYFRATYRTQNGQCGGIFRGNQGEIMSPNYPQNYSINTYCEWMISVENSYFLKYTFEELTLPQSENCSMGFVEVYKGLKSDENGRLIQRFCSKPEKSVDALTNRINVIFSSQQGPSYKGFLMKYKKACGGLMTESSGFLKSNANDEQCLWTIQASDEGTKISINFMQIECNCEELSETECLKNRGVKLSADVEGPALLAFCEHHPPDFISNGRNLVISARNVSFIAKYSTIETACGGHLTSLRGSFSSPYYPQTYPSNTECVWTITAPSGNYLELNFVELNIPSSDNCNQDYIEVHEKTANGKLLGVFCSSTLPTSSIRVFEQFWIKFRSSDEGVGKGFKISWTHAQLNEITGFNGEIQPPPVQSMHSEQDPFRWRITVPRDNVIKLVFKEYNRGLKLYDGFDENALPIDIQTSPWDVTSSTNVILLISDNEIIDHFLILWKALSKTSITKNVTITECNETLNLNYGSLANLSSPGYPKDYKNNMKCEWILKSDNPTQHAIIDLFDVRLEKISSCSADYVKISSSKNLVEWHTELQMCDSPPLGIAPIAEIHGTPYLKVEFTTDASVTRVGFTSKAYTACGGNLTASVGRILDMDVHNTTSGHDDNCTWHIEVRTGRKIQFTFEFPSKLAVNSSDQCRNYAIIRDGIDNGAAILAPGRICFAGQLNGTLTTSSNRAAIKYFLQPYNPFLSHELKLWNLTYREFSDCGGDVRLTSFSRSVNITSPNYPKVPHAYTECIWRIIVPPGESVQANFVDEFNLNVRHCNQEFVEFRDGSTELSRQLGKYCRRPGTVRSSGYILYMRYFTNIAEPRNGFKVNVSLSTCGGTFTQSNNVITSENYPAPGRYPSNSVCDYLIKLNTYFRINLTFTDIDLPFDKSNLNGSDHLRIYQVVGKLETRVEDELAIVYGNATSMPSIQTESSQVLIRFYSFKANNAFRGFRLVYDRKMGGCSRDVSGDSGVLTLSLQPRRMALMVHCRWQITVPKGRRVRFNFTEVPIMPANVTRPFKATFFNDFQMLSAITQLNLFNISTATSVQSTDNKMFVRIFGGYMPDMYRMQGTYSSTTLSSCPGDITTDTGSLSTNSLDLTSNFYCNLEFTLTDNETISFTVASLVVETTGQPSFAVRFRAGYLAQSLRTLNTNLTDEIVALAVKRGSITLLQSENIKVRKFEATFRKHPCGGDFRFEHKFDITLPNLQAGYGTLDCAWHLSTSAIKNGFDLSAYFSFAKFCAHEYVSVHLGPSIGNVPFARLCRGGNLDTERLLTKSIYVLYHATEYNPDSELNLTFERASYCGDKLTVEYTKLVEMTKNDYKRNMECVWELETQPGFYLRLEFLGRFFIEESKNCVKDYLEVSKHENGGWVTLPRYCGRDLPSAINSTSERMKLVFRTDDAISGDGFTLSVQRTCNAAFNVTREVQTIAYPSGWILNQPRAKCEYTLQTNTSKTIHVNVKKFGFRMMGPIGRRNFCSLNKFSVQKRSSDGEVVDLGQYCKDMPVTQFRARKWISMLYEALVEVGSYEIEFYLDDCGGEVTQPTWIKSLQSADGEGYENNMNCVWNITAPEGHNIDIQFKYLVMEAHDECSMDYVEIFRGSQVLDAQRVVRLCGNMSTKAPSFHIEGNSAVVVAITDPSITLEGFSARILFSKACDERMTLTEANTPVAIERSFVVANNEVIICRYNLMAPPGFRIELELAKIDLNGVNITCEESVDCDYIEILDSLEAGASTMQKFTRTTGTIPKLTSSSKDATIRTHFERQWPHEFKVNVKLVKSSCGVALPDDYLIGDHNEVIISSARKNGLYLPNDHCTFKITSKRDFEIRFNQFSLQNRSDVTGECLDYVSITYTNTYERAKTDVYCGSVSGYLLAVSKYNSVASAQIVFHTDETIESTGFVLNATNRLPCGFTYEFLSGGIKGPIPENEVCRNTIHLPPDYNVNILIPSFYSRSGNCSENYVKILDSATKSVLFEECKKSYSTRKFFTTSNKVDLDIRTVAQIETDILYFGSRKSLPPGCGGDLRMSNGILYSPTYETYTNASRCRWSLSVPAPNRIIMFFEEFNMGSVCRTDYIEIFDIADSGEETLSRHHCEQDIPEMFVSKGSKIAIVSVTSVDFDGTGWGLSFRIYREGSNPFRIITNSDDRINGT